MSATVLPPASASHTHTPRPIASSTSHPSLSSAASSASSSSSAAAPGLGSSNSNSFASSSMVNKPSLIEYRDFRFLIMDAPTESNLAAYTEMLVKRNVVAVVRACEPSYRTDQLTRAGIQVVEAAFADGDPPPQHTIQTWLQLVTKVFSTNATTASADAASSSSSSSSSSSAVATTAALPAASPSPMNGGSSGGKPVVAVHCVAGLGRAPVLVAVALMEAGMPPLDVIDFIRKRRRGALNSKQVKYIQSYKPRKAKDDKCIIC